MQLIATLQNHLTLHLFHISVNRCFLMVYRSSIGDLSKLFSLNQQVNDPILQKYFLPTFYKQLPLLLFYIHARYILQQIQLLDKPTTIKKGYAKIYLPKCLLNMDHFLHQEFFEKKIILKYPCKLIEKKLIIVKL